MFLPHPLVKLSIVESLRDREVACSASDLQGLNFASCVWRAVSSKSSHYPQEVLQAQFSLYVQKSGLNPDSFHFCMATSVERHLHLHRLSHTHCLLVQYTHVCHLPSGSVSQCGYHDDYPVKLIYLNFQPLEVVSRYRDPQPQVVENYSY